MLAHYHGQTLNSSKLGQALGVNHVTIRNYLDIMEQTFIKVSRGFAATLDLLKPERTWVVAPVSGSFVLRPGVTVAGIKDLLMDLERIESA